MKLKYILSVITFIAAFLFTNCSEDQKAVSNNNNNTGVPVKVKVVETKPFQKYYSFYSKLSGIKEATKGSMMGGKIEKITRKVGDFVSRDEVIVHFDENNPGLMYDQSKKSYLNAEKTYKRLKTLLEAGETSQANFDAAETQYLVAKRNFESLQQVLFVESPFAGTIVNIFVNEGDNVKNETNLFTVALLNKMRARVWASESEISQIKKGMPAEMVYNGTDYKGTVVEVSLAADPYKQAFYAEVEFDNPKRELKSGVVADIKVLTYQNSDAVVIPRNLVMKDDNGAFVFVANGTTSEKRYIQNGHDSGLDYEITNGLNKGDKLIIQGASLLDNNTKIKVIE